MFGDSGFAHKSIVVSSSCILHSGPRLIFARAIYVAPDLGSVSISAAPSISHTFSYLAGSIDFVPGKGLNFMPQRFGSREGAGAYQKSYSAGLTPAFSVLSVAS